MSSSAIAQLIWPTTQTPHTSECVARHYWMPYCPHDSSGLWVLFVCFPFTFVFSLTPAQKLVKRVVRSITTTENSISHAAETIRHIALYKGPRISLVRLHRWHTIYSIIIHCVSLVPVQQLFSFFDFPSVGLSPRVFT